MSDTDYQRVDGSTPPQFLTRSAQSWARLMESLPEPELGHDRRMLFCIVTDHNGNRRRSVASIDRL
ncbi:hypothetical protein GCM10007884_42160 [Methylobacterium brachythecii]|uniref:Transcriptional regulator n=1 Tax=Methylobacterium brachythecii TaxID=1176177 RepID=A0ABQ6D7E0_9HYPH|nr:hypothetical protein GCM10007884_42160 [Methylobacterium brachythecii]